MKPKRVAIVAEWLTSRGGAETVVQALLDIFPKADLFTTVFNEKMNSEFIRYNPRTSYLQRIPIINRRHQSATFLLLNAIKSLDLSGYDLIISSSSAIGKGIRKPKNAVHICYCHTPMRYAWEPEVDDRVAKLPFGKSLISYLKKWDLATNKGVDYFVANSKYTADRIKQYYNRNAIVIYPPVTIAPKQNFPKEDFYLVISRLVKYKRFDLAVKACKELNRRLVIGGDGPEFEHLKEISGEKTEFIGRVGNSKKTEYFAKARALIFPADEDFGIVPIEAMAQGTPIIAYKKGGVMETVTDGKTGVFFNQQDVNSLKSAIMRSEKIRFDQNELIKQAKKFSKEAFSKKIRNFIDKIS